MKPGIEVSERTVSRLLPRRRKPPSQTWKGFLNNYVQDLVSIDFFTVATATFRLLFVLVALISGGECSISTSRSTRRALGPGGRWLKHCRTMLHRGICPEIGIRFMARSCAIACEACGSLKC